jgi:hypothetical protein
MGYHLRNASKYFDLERREIKTVSGGSVMGGIGNGNDFFKSHFPNHRLFLDVLPHMAVEGNGEFTKGTSQDSPLYQIGYKVFFLPTTDRARKR